MEDIPDSCCVWHHTSVGTVVQLCKRAEGSISGARIIGFFCCHRDHSLLCRVALAKVMYETVIRRLLCMPAILVAYSCFRINHISFFVSVGEVVRVRVCGTVRCCGQHISDIVEGITGYPFLRHLFDNFICSRIIGGVMLTYRRLQKRIYR